ncbi:DNA sulfur modification protein DndD [Haloterrigena alkaliphila]|uniref:DNA sulfur modification protein DndD n=1 Tax=Haloterrigena alkaliphila TaxID=2816475 RepID=A0A8A2VL32_9EURY|nr:DNA sulfur modification protein DndD [Haloterrigena alkaliphila]QSX01105.1 DNA sulfur modification protein DndD [Haloterrigena alkaliphila]
MKLTRVLISNYGPYGGENPFNLQTTDDQPIVLFGGKNGAGKTSFFTAVQLCLHGQSAFGSRTSRSEYEKHLQDYLHESNGHQATEAEITVEFEYGNFGSTDHYTVTRKWRDRGKSIVEDLTIKRNGSQLSDLEEDQWEDFLKELIPPGMSELFFFDGEKIQQLATAIENGDDFQDSLYSLLGLDLVDRLDTDLQIYQTNKLDESGHEEIVEKIEELDQDIEEYRNEQTEVEEHLAEKTARLEEIEAEIEQKETELSQEGGGFAKKRDKHKERRAELNATIESLEEDIRDHVRGSYPFALAPDLCNQVVDRLEMESEATAEIAAQNRVVTELDELADEDEVWDGLDVSVDKSKDIVQTLQSELFDRLADDLPDEIRLAREFSERQRQEMYTVADRALSEVPDELRSITDELERATRERQDIEDKLSRTPEQSVLSPLIKEINDLTEERGELTTEIEQLENRLEELENYIGRLEQERENKIERYEDLDDVSDRADLAQDVRSAVQDYQDKLAQQKLKRLESVLTDHYLALSNKSQFYDQVEIDPDETTIQIKTVGGESKNQSQLSAGERQIFATAMLWALADISDRPLPFMIDTPLGRLDQEHRENLVRNFFPDASHQVLLFSTDTEITQEFYEILEEDIAAEYHLTYDEEMGQTHVEPGYFWSDGPDDVLRNDDIEIDTDHQIQLEGFNNE